MAPPKIKTLLGDGGGTSTPLHDHWVANLDNNIEGYVRENFATWSDKTCPEGNELRTTWEKPVHKGEGKFAVIVGYLDLIVEWGPEFPWTSGYGCLLFEVKPKIESIGETIRQIRTYEQFVQPLFYTQQVIVACPEPQHAELFRAQRIPYLVLRETP